jgi:transposase
MEVFTPPPYREKRAAGRPTKLTQQTRMLVAQKVVGKEFTYREAAKAFGISSGAVSACVREFKKQGIQGKRSARRQEINEEIASYRHQAQIKELKQEIADLFLENQVLKKILNKPLLVKKYDGSVITTENLAESQEAAR